MDAQLNSIGALFPAESERIEEAIAALVRLGVLPGALTVITRSSQRTRHLCESYYVQTLDLFEKPRNSIGEFLSLRDEAKRPTVRDIADVFGSLGLDGDRAAYFAQALAENVLLVLDGKDVTADRMTTLIRLGADLGLANAQAVERIIPLRAEQIDVEKSVVVTNEVSVTTEVISEVKTFDVQVRREEFVIRRTHVGENGRVETLRIPLRHEEVDITKRTVITEEVAVHTEAFLDVRHIEETVRHEVLEVVDQAVTDEAIADVAQPLS